MRISGQIFDLYDDQKGEVLRDLFPTQDALPEVVKEAHALSPGERQALPDDVFALVLVNEGEKFRKYACTDPGNTILSVSYFLKNAHKLPEEARQVAAENLKIACSWYGITPPEELEKVAVLGFVAKKVMSNPLGALQTAFSAPAVAQGVKNEISARHAVTGGGGMIVTPHQVREAMGKHADVVGTPDMPLQNKTTTPSKVPISKVAVMRSVVDVTGKDVKKTASPIAVTLFALGDKYPLDNYAQVKQASAYFDEYARHFTPEERREYCSKMVKRADALGIDVSRDARKYASDNFASEEEIKVAFDARRILLQDRQDDLDLLEAIEKRAKFRAWRDGGIDFDSSAPWVIAEALCEFDKQAGLDLHYDDSVPDAYYSIFGSEKAAADKATLSDYSWVLGNDMVVGHELARLAQTSSKSLRMTFGDDFAKEFKKDPIGIFKSLPNPQKKIIARMANDAPAPIELGL